MTPTAFPLPLRRQILILAALFALSLPLVTTRLYASDEVQYFSYLRSLWFDHDVSFENEYQHFYDAGTVRYDGFRETFLERTTETGRRVNFGTIGSALLWSPFYAVADAYARVARSWGSTVAADGYSAPYVAAVAYGSACYAWLALLCGLGIARHVLLDPHVPPDARKTRDPREPREGRERQQSSDSHDRCDPRSPHDAHDARGTQNLRDSRNARVERRIFAATLAIWIGTPLFFYMYIAPPMAHACSAFVVGAFVLAWLKVRTQWSLRGLILLGALAALMGMTREQDLFIAIGPALDWAATLWQQLRAGALTSDAASAQDTSGGSAATSDNAHGTADAGGSGTGASDAHRHRAPGVFALVLHALAGAAAFVLAFMPQLAAYVALNGYPGPTRLVARKMNLLAPHAFGVLLSPRHGLLFWTPLVVLALAGLVWLAVRRDDELASASAPTSTPANQAANAAAIAGAIASGPDAADAPAGAAGNARPLNRVRHEEDPRPTRAAQATRAAQETRATQATRATLATRSVTIDRRRIALCMLAIVASQVYIAGSVESWTVAGAFGQRRFVGLSAVFLLGLAALLVQARAGWMRRGAVTLAALSIWWNLAMMAQFATGLMDRQRLELGRNAYHAFVTIPGRVPELAYRYIFARRSFYKPPTSNAPAGSTPPGGSSSRHAPSSGAPFNGAPFNGALFSGALFSGAPSGDAPFDSAPSSSASFSSALSGSALSGSAPSGAGPPDRAIEARGEPRSATVGSRIADAGRMPMDARGLAAVAVALPGRQTMSRAHAAVAREARG